MTKTKGCESFLHKMRKRVPTLVPRITKVQGQEVVHFSFLELLHNLLSSTKFQDIDNLCANRDKSSHFGKFMPTSAEDCSEIMTRDWANDTFESLEDFDPDNDFFLPLVLYGDKTGTDVNQPLKPWMFTTPMLCRHACKSAESWHHLGFIPSLDDAVIISDDDDEGPSPTNTKEKQQLYHDLMSVLIKEIEGTIENKPVMSINLGGLWQKRRLHIHVTAVMGDQLSQDRLVGRKLINSGNAGRGHRVCISLAVQASNVSNNLHTASKECCLVNHEIIRQLNNLPLMELDPSVNGLAKTVNKAQSTDKKIILM